MDGVGHKFYKLKHYQQEVKEDLGNKVEQMK